MERNIPLSGSHTEVHLVYFLKTHYWHSKKQSMKALNILEMDLHFNQRQKGHHCSR